MSLSFFPRREQRILRSAIRVEWATAISQIIIVIVVFAVAAQSQAMKVAWIEDALSILPPAAFLVAVHLINRVPDDDHPYGYHRSIGAAHLVAATALFAVGAYLAIDSAITLISAEHPQFGNTTLFGVEFWSGWLMITVAVAAAIPPIFLGNIKMKLAEPLHDKVLYADAYMSKANWTSALATVIGIIGIKFGLWWADSAAAIVVSLSIMRDGIRNLHAAISGLTDSRARTYDNQHPHPLLDGIDEILRNTDWADQFRTRVRDEGHVFHVEAFLVPKPHYDLAPSDCQSLVEALRDLDWKIHDVVVAPLPELPTKQAFPREEPLK